MHIENGKGNLLIESLLIFSCCFIVYLSNGRALGAGDTVPNSLLALNWLQNHTLDFDRFRDSYLFPNPDSLPYFFAESINGKITSVYPIGTSVVTFPIYYIFSVYLNFLAFLKTSISGVPFTFDITSIDFEPHRQIFEKISATIVTSLSVAIFHIATRLKFQFIVAFITSFIYAFATNTWVTNSQALWQHTATGLVLTSLILCLLKANRVGISYLRLLLLVAGFFCGLLIIIRPTNVFFCVAAVLYVISVYKKAAFFFLLSFPVSILGLVWNLYNFGEILGGYSALKSTYELTFYRFDFAQFLQAFGGLLFSPSRGIFIFSPIVILCIPGFWKAVKKVKFCADEKLLVSLSVAAIALFLSYCFYTIWWSGGSYGPRFISDATPISCYLVAYCIETQAEIVLKKQKIIFITNLAVFLFLLAISTGSQVIGVFGKADWSGLPVDVDTHPSRLWNFKDTQLSRHANSLFFQIVKPLGNLVKYSQALEGLIQGVEKVETERLDNPSPIPDIVNPEELVLLSAQLKNIGESRWFGYESGLMPGETRVRLRVFDGNAVQLSETRLLVSGFAKQNDAAKAIGSFKFPRDPGVYRLVFDLIAEGIGEFPSNSKHKPYEVKIMVQPHPTKKL